MRVLTLPAAAAVLFTLASAQSVDNSGLPACTEAGYNCVRGACIDHATQARCDPSKEAIMDTIQSQEGAYQLIQGGSPSLKADNSALLTLITAFFFHVDLLKLVLTGQELLTAHLSE